MNEWRNYLVCFTDKTSIRVLAQNMTEVNKVALRYLRKLYTDVDVYTIIELMNEKELVNV